MPLIVDQAEDRLCLSEPQFIRVLNRTHFLSLAVVLWDGAVCPAATELLADNQTVKLIRAWLIDNVRGNVEVHRHIPPLLLAMRLSR